MGHNSPQPQEVAIRSMGDVFSDSAPFIAFFAMSGSWDSAMGRRPDLAKMAEPMK